MRVAVSVAVAVGGLLDDWTDDISSVFDVPVVFAFKRYSYHSGEALAALADGAAFMA